LSHTACLESPLSVGDETVIGMTAILGYARVSTTGQELDAQLAVFTAAGVDTERVFTDKLSGSARIDRPGLTAMLDYARAGDTVVVTAIDRLGRSVAEVTHTIADLGERGILLCALREGIDTATPTDAPSPLSWPRWPSLSSSSAANAAPHLADPAGPGSCLPPNRPS
jgi:Resolvase, N terminal domain